jgi:alpha-beta hydrolase superfamily lysophospholipase
MKSNPTPPERGASPAVCSTDFTTFGTWFGRAERPIAGWWTSPKRPSRDGVVIASPLGYEYWSCYRSLRTLAESLARAGWHVLRFDWDGTGNSAGAADDPHRVSAWRASLAAAVTAMRESGIQRVTLLGVRLGATFALLDAAALGADAVVACAPVTCGKRWLRELKMLGVAHPNAPGTMIYSGLVVDPVTAAELAAIDLVRDVPPAAGRTLLVTRAKGIDAPFIDALAANGRALDVHTCESMQKMLDAPAGEDAVPEGFIEPIVRWLGAGPACGSGARPPLEQTAEIPWPDDKVIETFTTVADLAALCARPCGSEPDTVVVFLNSGADPHVGPGRAWVEYSRELALHGYACVRPDFTAFGESPNGDRAPGRPYDPHCLDDTAKIVTALRRRYARVVLAGLCVGAWIAMKVAQRVRVDGIFALNPQLWWKPGMPIIIRIPDTIAWRAPMRVRGERLARLGVWSLLDALAIRPMASRWMVALRRRRIPVMLSYAEGDDGLVHLMNRCARRIVRESRHGLLAVEEVTGIDHPMFRLWRRPAIVRQMLRFLAGLPPAQTAQSR